MLLRPFHHAFWGRRGIGMMADGGHHGEGEHDERDVAMPAMPGTGLIVVEAEFVFCGLETILDRPAMPLHIHKLFDRRPGRTPCREVGQIAVCDVSADQKAARPKAGERIIVFVGVEIGEVEIRPVVEPLALGPFAR